MNDLQQRMEQDEGYAIPSSETTYGITTPTPGITRRAVKEVFVDNPNAIVPIGETSMAYKRVLFTDHGLEYPHDFTEFEWADVGVVLKNIEGVVTWNVADWAAYAYDHLKKSYAEIAQEFQYEPDTLELYASIARNVLPQVRLISNQALPFSHARVIAPLSQHIALQEALAFYAMHFRLKVEDFKIHKWLLDDMDWEAACWRIEEAVRDNILLTEYADFADKLAQRNRKPAAVVKAFDDSAKVLKKYSEQPYALKGKKLDAARAAVARMRAWLDTFESQLSGEE